MSMISSVQFQIQIGELNEAMMVIDEDKSGTVNGEDELKKLM